MKVLSSLYRPNNPLLLAFVLNFLGFYCVLLVLANLNLLTFSRYLTVPLRVLIVSLLCLAFIRSPKHAIRGSSLLFLVFSALYFMRIAFDYLSGRPFYIEYTQVFFYYTTFAFVPFLVNSHIFFSIGTIERMQTWFIRSALLFSVAATIIYASFIGQVGRLTSGASDGDLISPLILSYCSALVIGVGMNLWLTTKLTRRNKMLVVAMMIFALPPFFLGASRGSIIAIILPIIYIVITNRRFVTNLKVFLTTLFALILLLYIADYFGSNIFNRFLNIFSDIESNSSSSERVMIWSQSFSQFLESPIIGDRMQLIGYNIYPHNLFLEVLQNLGVVGFVPFLCLVIIGLRVCYLLFRYHRPYCWIGVFFLQALSQNLFSGAVYSASWFWFSLGLVISVQLSLKVIKNRRRNELPTSL